MNPLTLGDTPEDYIENDDGSVEIPGLEPVAEGNSEFYDNLAESLPSDDLAELGATLVELVEKDKESRKKRDKQYEEGLRRTGLGDDAPGGAQFEGASRVVHPVLAEACVDFSSRAIKELFPSSGPVKAWVQGEITPQKTEKADRKSRFMNWQLTTQIEEYRSELEQLLTQLPMGGSQYQKFWYDDRFGRPRSEFTGVDEIFLPYAATNFYTAQRVTHRQLITKAEFRNRVDSGLYRDVFVPDTDRQIPDQTRVTIANDKIEGREEDGYNEDGLRAVLEIYCWEEFEGDSISNGDYAPYIITIDEDSEEVLAVYRNWAEGDVRLRKLDWLVEWKFIPWRGAYGIGLPHLIGGLSAALTGALRALMDSAHINNAPTMLKLKSGRVVGQNTQVNVTQVCDIEGPTQIDDVRKLAMPMPFNQPSPVLAQLMDSLYGLAKGVISTSTEQLASVGDRTPVGTTMALIEQGSTTYSAIHARLHESQKKALAILHRINGTYLDIDEVIQDGADFGLTPDDFKGPMDVIPVSDPTIFSEAQRFAQSQAIMQMAQGDAQNPNVPWNQVNVRRRVLKQMRIDNIDDLLPAPKDPVTSDAVIENAEGLRGSPLKADVEQDHMTHIQTHLAFISSPLQSQNPLVPPQIINGVIMHIEEHIQMLEEASTKQALQMVLQQSAMAGQMISTEQAGVQATQQVQSALSQQLQPVLQQIAQLQQALQQRSPQPQMPPEVQATLQIGMAEIERKKAYDQATLQMKQQDAQGAQQRDVAEFQTAQQAAQMQFQADQQAQQFEQQAAQMEFQLKQQRMQFEQQVASAKLQFEQSLAQMQEQSRMELETLKQRVELMKNQQDNEQERETHLAMNHEDNLIKRQTDIEVNREDNDTKLVIAGIQSSQDTE